MRNSLWKLTLLTVVVGAGLAFVLYAQRSLNLGLNLANESPSETETSGEEIASKTTPTETEGKKEVSEAEGDKFVSARSTRVSPKRGANSPHPLGGQDPNELAGKASGDPFAGTAGKAGGEDDENPFGDRNRITTVGGISPKKPASPRGGLDFRDPAGQPRSVGNDTSPFEKQPQPNLGTPRKVDSSPFPDNSAADADPFQSGASGKSSGPSSQAKGVSTAGLNDPAKPFGPARTEGKPGSVQLVGHEKDSAPFAIDKPTERSPNELLDAPGRVSLTGRPMPGKLGDKPTSAAGPSDNPFGGESNFAGPGQGPGPKPAKNAPLLIGPTQPNDGANPLTDDPRNKTKDGFPSGSAPLANSGSDPKGAAVPSKAPQLGEGSSPFGDSTQNPRNEKSSTPLPALDDGPFSGSKPPLATKPKANDDPFGGSNRAADGPAAKGELFPGDNKPVSTSSNPPGRRDNLDGVKSLPTLSESDPKLGTPSPLSNDIPLAKPGNDASRPREPRDVSPFGTDPLNPAGPAPTGASKQAEGLVEPRKGPIGIGDPLNRGPEGVDDDPLNAPRKPLRFSGSIPGEGRTGREGSDRIGPSTSRNPANGQGVSAPDRRDSAPGKAGDPFGVLDGSSNVPQRSAARTNPLSEPRPVPTSGQERPAELSSTPGESTPFGGADRRMDDTGARRSPQPLGEADPNLRPITPPSKLNTPADVTRIQPAVGSSADRSTGLHESTVRSETPAGMLSPQLKIEKIAPENAVLGKPMIYQIVVKNVGNVAANQVVVEDRIPKGSELNGTIPQAELSGKKLQWKLGTIKPGEERKIAIRVVPIAEGQIGSIATVNFVAEVAAETKVTTPRLDLEFTGPSRGQVGQNLPFRFKVTNKGDSDAKGVYIRDIVPDGLRHADGADLEYEVGTLGPGKSFEIELPLQAVKAGPTINRAVATADGNVRVESSVKVDIVGSRLLVARTGPKARYVGRHAVYTNVVSNESNSPALGVRVIETVPEGMDFVEATSGGQFDPARRTVAWSFQKLEPKERQSLSVKLLAKKEGTHKSVVSAVDELGGRVQTVSQTEVEGFAAVGVSIPGVEAPVMVGEDLTLRVTVQNRGTGSASNVRVSFTLPEELEFVSLKGPIKHQAAGRTIRLDTIPSLRGREKHDLEIVVRGKQKGDARITVLLESDQLQRPLVREEAIPVLERNP